MTYNISDLMAGLRDDTLELRDPHITSADRIQALVLGQPVPKRRKMPRRLGRTALVAALFVVLLVAAAVAVAAPGFYEAAFGDLGLPDTEGEEGITEQAFPYAPAHWVIPGIQWSASDPAEAEALLGDYAVTLDRTITLGDYTVRLDSFVMDVHGTGVLVWSVEHPAGAFNVLETDRQELVFTEGAGLSAPVLETDTGDPLLLRHTKNHTLSTETQLYIVTHVGRFEGRLLPDEHIRMRLAQQTEKNGAPVSVNNAAITFPEATPLPCVPFTDGNHTVWLTPLSLFLEERFTPADADYISLWGTDKAIRFADGSVYTLMDGDALLNNTTLGYLQHSLDGTGPTLDPELGVSFVAGYTRGFNRLIDPEAATAIELEMADGSLHIFTPCD